MREKGMGMIKFIRALSYTDIVLNILSQLLLVCFAILIFVFGNDLSAGDFTLTRVFSDVMFVFIMLFVANFIIITVLLIIRQLRFDKTYRRYFRIIDAMYFLFAAVLPIYFWQMWMTYDFKVKALIFSLLIQFMILLNAFFSNRYLRQYIALREKKPKEKNPKDPVIEGIPKAK